MSQSIGDESRILFFESRIISGFESSARMYPWRIENDPYKILIAEVMLQRTKADQVVPIYLQFIEKFGNVRILATAQLHEIEHYIEKLGLRWRIRLIKSMAGYIVKHHGGRIPADRKTLLEIPGIGDYIADALLVFAFDRKRTVIDSNVVRLVTRFFGIKSNGEMRRNSSFVNFCTTLSENIPEQDVKKFNWGMLDHSAAICTPKPRCNLCPLSSRCSYFQQINQK